LTLYFYCLQQCLCVSISTKGVLLLLIVPQAKFAMGSLGGVGPWIVPVNAYITLLCSCCSPTADALSSSSTSDLGESAKDAAKDAGSDLKAKAKSLIKGNSALPNSMAVVADLNADVRGEATNYRDPAIAVPQDKAAGTPLLAPHVLCQAGMHALLAPGMLRLWQHAMDRMVGYMLVLSLVDCPLFLTKGTCKACSTKRAVAWLSLWLQPAYAQLAQTLGNDLLLLCLPLQTSCPLALLLTCPLLLRAPRMLPLTPLLTPRAP
jgi:hypothetical protein